MVNHVTNDRGVSVIAIGAPGSLERVKCERPVLIGSITNLIRRSGIKSQLEINAVFQAASMELTGQKYSSINHELLEACKRALPILKNAVAQNCGDSREFGGSFADRIAHDAVETAIENADRN